jgi:hypothetical protein
MHGFRSTNPVFYFLVPLPRDHRMLQGKHATGHSYFLRTLTRTESFFWSDIFKVYIYIYFFNRFTIEIAESMNLSFVLCLIVFL